MISEVSHELYDDSRIVEYYAHKSGLVFGEETLINEMRPALCGARILDLGVGAGRTTPFLLDCRPVRYVGVDYAENMVARCRERFPGVDFRVADARDLRAFGDGEFDLALFSWSGIDYLTHEGRLQVMAEVHRVLTPGGKFVFTTANGRKLPARPWTREALANMELRPTLKGLAYGLKEFLVGCENYLGLRGSQLKHDDYAIQVDTTHNFRLLRYFIRPEMQEAQLLSAGFINVRAVDKNGAFRDVREPEFVACPVCYVCAKPA